jgi:hypothetical protein
MTMPWSKRKPFPYWLNIDVGRRDDQAPRRRPDGRPLGAQARRGEPDDLRLRRPQPVQGKALRLRPAHRGRRGVGPAVTDATRYKYARRCDCSIGGQRGRGRTSARHRRGRAVVNQMQIGKHGRTTTLFALIGKYVYRNAAGVWILSRTDAGGYQHLQGVQYKGTPERTGSGPPTTTASSGATTARPGRRRSCRPGSWPTSSRRSATELWVFGGNANGNNVLRIVTWWARATRWMPRPGEGRSTSGSTGASATWLRAIDDKAYYFKEDGIFSITVDGSGHHQVNDLFPDLRNVTAARYGRNAAPWKGALWFQFGDTFWKLDGDGNLEPAGLERSWVWTPPPAAGRRVRRPRGVVRLPRHRGDRPDEVRRG